MFSTTILLAFLNVQNALAMPVPSTDETLPAPAAEILKNRESPPSWLYDA